MKLDDGLYSGNLKSTVPFLSSGLRSSPRTFYQKLAEWLPTPSIVGDSHVQVEQKMEPGRQRVESESVRKERIRKEFEEGLDQRIRHQLPSIEILQVIEATVLPATPSPVVKATTSVPEITTAPSVPTTAPPAPTTIPPAPTTIPPKPTPSSPTLVTPISTNPPESTPPLVQPTPHTPYLIKPNPWSRDDPRFQDVTARRFVGSQEVPYSLFDDRSPSPFI